MLLNIENNTIDTNKIFAITSIELCGNADATLENGDGVIIEAYKFKILSEGNNKIEIFLSGFNKMFNDFKGDINEEVKEILEKLRKDLIYHWNKDNPPITEIKFKF